MKIQHMGIFLFLWIGFSISLGEHIPANNGLGWDGVTYASISAKFDFFIKNKSLNVYSIQRVFPCFLIYCSSKFFNFSVTNQNVAFLFSLLNTSLLCICFFVLNKIGELLQWGKKVKIISFAGLFFNFANLKMPFYYPVLTDLSALTIGLSMVYCYLNKKNWLLFTLSIIGAFTFPTLLCMGMILFLFPLDNNKATTQGLKQYNPIIGFFVASIITTISLFLVQKNFPPATLGKNHSLPIFYLSIFSLFLFLFSVYKYLFPYKLKMLTSSILLSRCLIVLCLVIVILLIVNLLSNNEKGPLNFISYFIYISHGALAYPLNFMVSHTFYYGSIIILLAFFWKEITDYIFQKGSGALLLAGMYGILFIGSESRQLSNLFPFIVIAVCEVLNKKAVSWRFVYFFVLINLVLSRFWLPLNHGNWPSLSTSPPETTLEFPLQWYFMNFGPWLAPSMYWVLSIITIFLFFGFYLVLKKEKMLPFITEARKNEIKLNSTILSSDNS